MDDGEAVNNAGGNGGGGGGGGSGSGGSGSVGGGGRFRRHSMVVVVGAFDGSNNSGNCDGLRQGDGETKMVFDTSGGGWRRWASAFDDGDGQQEQRWQRRMTMAFNSGGAGQWQGGGEATVMKMAFDSGGGRWQRQWTVVR